MGGGKVRDRGSARQRWDRRYGEREHDHGRAPSPFLRSSLPWLESGDALDLAMGEGRNALFLAANGFRVTGVDISPVAVARCRTVAIERGLEVRGVVADLASWELGDGRWDLITKFYFLERTLFPRIVRALRPGGRLILEHFSADHPKIAPFGPRNPDYLLAPGEALELCAGLRLRYYRDAVIEVDEGRHRGPAALIQMIAERPPSA